MNRTEMLEQQTARRKARRPAPTKKFHVIKPRSKKRIEEQKVYVGMVKKIIAEDNLCKINSPECTNYADGLHHIQKRTPSNFLKEDNLRASCNACNNYIEEQIEWAKVNGFLKSRFQK